MIIHAAHAQTATGGEQRRRQELLLGRLQPRESGGQKSTVGSTDKSPLKDLGDEELK